MWTSVLSFSLLLFISRISSVKTNCEEIIISGVDGSMTDLRGHIEYLPQVNSSNMMVEYHNWSVDLRTSEYPQLEMQ